jgi:FkbM family methyltransferase
MGNGVISRLYRSVYNYFRGAPNLDLFLQKTKGVIHIGANHGQERTLYANYGLNVIWVEPNPAVFSELVENISNYPNQKAYEQLIGPRDGETHTLHISNNGGNSSSILAIAGHKKIWKDVTYTGDVRLVAATLGTFIAEKNIKMDKYDALVLDTQGSELMILKGAADVLKKFQYVKCEVADFESYKGCCKLADLGPFMVNHGFVELSRYMYAGSPRTGHYFDVVYKRR